MRWFHSAAQHFRRVFFDLSPIALRPILKQLKIRRILTLLPPASWNPLSPPSPAVFTSRHQGPFGWGMRPERLIVRSSFPSLSCLAFFYFSCVFRLLFFFFFLNGKCERNLVVTSLLTTSFSIGIIITENPTKRKAQWGFALDLMRRARTRLPDPSLRSPRVSPHLGTGAAPSSSTYGTAGRETGKSHPTSPILKGQVREPPDIAQPHCITHHGEDEIQLAGPVPSGFVFIPYIVFLKGEKKTKGEDRKTATVANNHRN